MEKEITRPFGEMKIVADKNIPFVEEAFGKLGEVATLPGRQINSSAVKEADVLLVRTVTRVDERLLKGSRVRFVATATIGLDHVDLDYLKKKGIRFASATGCNANSVAEYIVAALLILAQRYEFSLSGKTIGVVGVGNVGSRVVEKAGILGMNVLQNDPPLARKTGESRFRPLEELLQKSDILTLHVPLSHEGEDATYHMANEALFEKMKKGGFFINTSRGAVADSPGLLKALKSKRLSGTVLDVWEGEPEISEELLQAVDLGTPHIAGYSREGKANATLFIYQGTCRFLSCVSLSDRQAGVDRKVANWQPTNLPPPLYPEIGVHCEDPEQSEGDEAILSEVVRKAYDLEGDDRALRGILKIPLPERGAYFDRLRNEYPVRREFHSFKVKLVQSNEKVLSILQALGFKSY